jgi:hypothetical protein
MWRPRSTPRGCAQPGRRGGVRTTRDEFINNLNQFALDPASRRLWVYNAFIQDRIQLTPSCP